MDMSLFMGFLFYIAVGLVVIGSIFGFISVITVVQMSRRLDNQRDLQNKLNHDLVEAIYTLADSLNKNYLVRKLEKKGE